MPHFRPPRCFPAALLLAAWLSCAGAAAAELGDPVVKSHIGQNLIADIELTGMPDPAVPVQVHLAHPDVYRGANIKMAPVLSSVYMSVMRRDGRQFLHLTSTRPVESDYLHLFLDLNDGSRRDVRAVTLWFTPDPQPAPPPVVAPVVAVATPAPLRKTPAAAPAAPAACPQVSAEQLRTCAALDYKNGLLQARIVELEEKVKALQTTLDEGAPAAAPALAPAPVKHAAAAPPPKKVKVERFPWRLVGGVVSGLMLVAAAVIWLRQRRKRKAVEVAGSDPQPGLLARLTSRLRRKKAEPATE